MNIHTKSRAGRLASIAGAASLVAMSLTAMSAGAVVKPHVSYAKTLACEVTDVGGVQDKSFNASAYAGLLAGGKLSKNITTKVISSPNNATDSVYASEIAALVAQHCNVIITVGFLMSDATKAAATANPSVHFAQVDNTNQGQSNIMGLTYNTQEDAFLGGYEAAAYAAAVNPSAPKVATYGGMQFGSVTTYMDGYADGAAYYNTTKKPAHAVTVLGWNEKTQTGTFADSFGDTVKGASLTNAFLAQGATTIFPVAGGVGFGTNSAVRTWNASHSVKANVEWVDTDGCVSDATDCDLFLNSVTKGVGTSVTAAIVTQATGMFAGGNYVGTLKNGGAAFVQDSQSAAAKMLSASVLKDIKTITAGIISGKIKVLTGGQ